MIHNIDCVTALEPGDAMSRIRDCVVRGVKHWIETGDDVAEDRFGWNPLYSRPRAMV